MSNYILTLNAGSSSIKFGVFDSPEGSPELVAKDQVEGIATNPHFVAKSAEGNLLSEAYWVPVTGRAGHRLAFRIIWGWLSDAYGTDDILAIGHRIAHGGAAYPEAVAEATATELIIPSDIPYMKGAA